MKTRMISSLMMLPFFILLYAGGLVLAAACLFLSFIAMREFFHSFRAAGIKPSLPVGAAALAALYCLEFLVPPLYHGQALAFWLTLAALASFLCLFDVEKRRLEDGIATLAGIVYTGFFSFHITLVDRSAYPLMVWLIFLSAFGADILAYFTGRSLGRRKLCPAISPKKTVAGAVGGLIGGTAFCSAFGYFFMPDMLIHCLAIGLAGGAFSQLGDLTASVFKRKLGIKDYGKLIPGHGGVLDRIDSVLFTAPLVYYYIWIVLVMAPQTAGR